MATRVLYPGTFDPVTNGHIDIALRAANLFDHVIVAIADSTKKCPLFSVEERITLCEENFKGTSNIEVIGFNHLLSDLAIEKESNIILRGIRAVSDYEYEYQLAAMNRQLAKDVETIFFIPSDHLSYISSSLVKEIASFKGDVSSFVPSNVEQALQQRLLS